MPENSLESTSVKLGQLEELCGPGPRIQVQAVPCAEQLLVCVHSVTRLLHPMILMNNDSTRPNQKAKE